MMFECIDKIYPSVSIDTVTGSICNFTDNIGGLPLKSCTSLISGYQDGSGTPSPDNVRPLHAFSSATLNKTGKNLIPDKRYQYNANNLFLGVDNSDITHTIYLNSGEYTFSISSELTGIVLNLGNSQTSHNTTSNKYTFTVTTPDYYRFWVYKSGITSVDIDSFQLELGQQSTTYEPYNGNTYTFTFGQSIYQGYIDWMRGVAVGTWGYIASYNGETLTGEWLCNKAPYEVGTTPPTGSQVAYELATPITIPLGGINLLTQQGVNNIFADCGDTTVEYINIT